LVALHMVSDAVVLDQHEKMPAGYPALDAGAGAYCFGAFRAVAAAGVCRPAQPGNGVEI
jgi:hypothetical protein